MNIVHYSIFFAYYILGAFATTDILRLLNGATLPIWSANSHCPICQHKLSFFDQIPIFSYIFHKCRCKYCHSIIPIGNLLLEIIIFLVSTFIAVFSNFCWGGFVITFIFYETVKLIVLLYYGHRSIQFKQNLIISLLQNFFIFGIIAFLYCLAHYT